MSTGTAAALHFDTLLLPDGWANNVQVRIEGGRIAAIERDAAPRAGIERVVAGLPGTSNVHSHGFQRGMAGLTEYRGPAADNFWSWRELMYRFVARMTPDDLEAICAQAYVEMLESGFTRVGEFHYVHHDPAGRPYANLAEMTERVVAAAEQAGIALTLLPVFYAHGGFGGAPPNDGQRRFLNDVPAFARLLEATRRLVAGRPEVVVGVAPHSLRAVTPTQLGQIASFADGGPVHIHAAEQLGEVEHCLAWSGARPVQWLLDHAGVDEHWCLVHATHMNDEEIARLAASGAVAGLCPITEANLGDGIGPAKDFAAAGGVFGIGTDSNVLIGVNAELRQLEYSQRLRDRARNVIAAGEVASTGRGLFDAVVRGGARALGVDGARAGLVVGASADFVALDAQSPVLAGRSGDALIDSFLFASANHCVSEVWRAGRKLVAGGRHVAREHIERRYRAALGRVLVG